jgi:hypothetical protein
MSKKEEVANAELGDQFDKEMYDQESSGGDLFKFEKVGDKLNGLIVSNKVGKTKLGDATFYTIQTAEGEKTFVPTKALKEDLDKFVRMFGLGKFIAEIVLESLKPGNYASPFKVFRVRAGIATEARLARLGINTYDQESSSEGE